MEEALKEAWATIPVIFFEDLVESMERRVRRLLMPMAGIRSIERTGWESEEYVSNRQYLRSIWSR
jgi:hypothetical protein